MLHERRSIRSMVWQIRKDHAEAWTLALRRQDQTQVMLCAKGANPRKADRDALVARPIALSCSPTPPLFPEPPHHPTSAHSVERRPHLRVVSKNTNRALRQKRRGPIGADGVRRLAAARPGDDPAGPGFQRLVVVAADIELFRAVQPAIDEVGGHIHQERPFHRVGADQRDVIGAQQLDEGRVDEALMADFHGVAKWPRGVGFRADPPGDTPIVPAGQPGRASDPAAGT